MQSVGGSGVPLISNSSIVPNNALAAVDRQLVANGITTAFHGLTVSWEPGLRCLEHDPR